MAGSATHGGGGVTGIPALNVVSAIVHDRRTRRLHLPLGSRAATTG
jgi:phytoene dehydrogenase-like protein